MWVSTVVRPDESTVGRTPILVTDEYTTPLTVAVSNGFRPADVDAGSDDRRLLGVWIEAR